jgi:chemotaxis protein MotB
MRKKKHEEHENHERWLVSYADFITLLFAFFTVLYATAQTDKKKVDAAVESIKAAFEGGLPLTMLDRSPGSANIGLAETHVTLATDSTTLLESMRRSLQGSLSDNVVQVGFVNQNLTVALPARLAFAPGSAELHPTAYGVLADVAKSVKPLPVGVEVVGHADGVPLAAGSPFVDNWGLAAARAAATARYLQGRGIPADRIILTAGVVAKVEGEERAVTIRLRADSPRIGGELYEALDAGGLMGPSSD